MTRTPPDVVQDWFRAMQRGPDGEEALLALFDEEAEYVEPFGPDGQPRRHVGKSAIRASLRAAWREAPPDLRLVVDRMDRLDDGTVRTAWTCTSPAFPGPMRGVDEAVVRDGRIVRLTTTLVRPPG